MSAELVNLRRARRKKAREAAAEKSARNRARSGRSEAERALDSAREAQTSHELDGKKLDE